MGNVLISSDYPPDAENGGWYGWLSGVAKAVLGNSRKFRNVRQYFGINQKVVLMDFGYGDLMSIAQTVPVLNMVITKGASMFANAEIKHIGKNGKEIKDSPVMKLLNNPNPIDKTLESLMYKFYVMNSIYNNTFQYKNYARDLKYRGDDLPSLLWVLPSGIMQIHLSGQIYRQTDINKIILGFKMLNDPDLFTNDEIIFIPEGISANGINAGNRTEALQIPLSNVQVALKAMNIILGDRGMIGYFTTDSKDDAGPIPLSGRVKKAIKDSYKRENSVDSEQSHVGIFSQKTEFHPMTFDVEQLQILPMFEEVKGAICDAMGHDRDLYSSTKGATFENKEQALKQTYQNTMQPLLDKLLRHWSIDFGLDKVGEKLVGDYNWLPVLKKDALAEEKAFNQRVQAASILYGLGTISQQQMADICQVVFDGDGIMKALPTGERPAANGTESPESETDENGKAKKF